MVEHQKIERSISLARGSKALCEVLKVVKQLLAAQWFLLKIPSLFLLFI